MPAPSESLVAPRLSGERLAGLGELWKEGGSFRTPVRGSERSLESCHVRPEATTSRVRRAIREFRTNSTHGSAPGGEVPGAERMEGVLNMDDGIEDGPRPNDRLLVAVRQDEQPLVSFARLLGDHFEAGIGLWLRSD